MAESALNDAQGLATRVRQLEAELLQAKKELEAKEAGFRDERAKTIKRKYLLAFSRMLGFLILLLLLQFLQKLGITWTSVRLPTARCRRSMTRW